MDDEKLNYCQVVIENCRFKLPTSSTSVTKIDKMNSNISSRRYSIRLLDKGIPSMRESPPKKSKKRTKSETIVQKPAASSAVAVNDTENNSNQLELSDNDILKMLDDFTAFIEDGVLNETTKDVFNIDDGSGIQPDKMFTPTTSTNVNKDNGHSVLLPQPNFQACHSQTLVEQKRSICTETEAPVFYSTSCQTDFVQRRSTSVQTDFDQRSQSTQTCLDNQSSISVQTSSGNHSMASTNTGAGASGQNGLKRKTSSSTSDPAKCQIFINNYDLTNCSVNRGNFDYKIPKHSSNRDVDSGRPRSAAPADPGVFGSKIPKHLSNRDVAFGRPKSVSPARSLVNCRVFGNKLATHSTNLNVDFARPKSEYFKMPRGAFSEEVPFYRRSDYQSETSRPQSPKNNYELMKIKVFCVLQRPCLKFLKREDCGRFCKQNHFLPPASDVASAIENWSNEEIHFLYLSYIQRYKMCHQMYFDVICNAFVKNRSPENIIATIKDCERLSLEGQFIVVLFGLKKCGYTDDDALFEICTHANRSRNAVNEVLKVIVTFKMTNFKRTIAFLSSEMETIEFDPYFGNEILKQAVDVETLDVTLLNFCYDIVRKYSYVLNVHYMKSLLSKM